MKKEKLKHKIEEKYGIKRDTLLDFLIQLKPKQSTDYYNVREKILRKNCFSDEEFSNCVKYLSDLENGRYIS